MKYEARKWITNKYSKLITAKGIPVRETLFVPILTQPETVYQVKLKEYVNTIIATL
jgi:hypothetical protein